MHGRPPAGPSIAISFFLVAVACSFAGLCYAELASMIPIAGSAYTYSYATLGEIFAWIIGWDLILEYVVSNVAVAVGFAGYTKAQLAAFGINLPEKWASPVWACRAMDGRIFQSARLPDRLYSHAAAGARREGIGRDEQHHGRDQDRRDPDLPGGGRNAGEARELDALRALWLFRNCDGRRDRFLYLHRIRFGFNRRRGIAQSAKRFALRHHHVADCLHSVVCRRRCWCCSA